MAPRLILVLIAIAGGLYAAGGLAREEGCRDVLRAAFRMGLGEPVGDGRAFAARVEAECRGSRDPALAANALLQGGHAAEAVAVTDVALRREPENAGAWVVLARALRARGLAGAAGRAEDRARRLNPLGVPARAASPQG